MSISSENNKYTWTINSCCKELILTVSTLTYRVFITPCHVLKISRTTFIKTTLNYKPHWLYNIDTLLELTLPHQHVVTVINNMQATWIIFNISILCTVNMETPNSNIRLLLATTWRLIVTFSFCSYTNTYQHLISIAWRLHV